jgi:hypothetical protein
MQDDQVGVECNMNTRKYTKGPALEGDAINTWPAPGSSTLGEA